MLRTRTSTANEESCLSFLDFFSTPLEIWFDGRSKSYSTIGFLLTIGMIGLLSAVVKSSGTQLLYREKPRVNHNLIHRSIDSINVEDYDKADLSILSPILRFDFLRSSNIAIGSLIDIKAYQSIYTYDNQLLSKTQYELIPCSQNNNFAALFNTTDYTFSKLTEYSQNSNTFCFKDLHLVFNSSARYEIILGRCEQQCLRSKEAMDIMNNLNSITLLLLDNEVNTGNFSSPSTVQANEFQVNININSRFSSKKSLRFKGINLQSDIGFIMQAYTSQFFFSLDSVIDSIDDFGNEAQFKFLTFELRYSDKVEEIVRYFMKAQDLAALIGGILKVYILVATLISNFFSSNFQMLSMINKMFKYTETEKLKKGKRDINQVIKPQSSINQNTSQGKLNVSQGKLNLQTPLHSAKENNYFNQDNSRYEEEINEIAHEKDNILSKLSLITTTKLAKSHLMTTDYKYSSFKFILMRFFPFCKSVKDEKKTYRLLLTALKKKLDLREVFHEVINFKRFKSYFCNRDQLLLLNLDSKLTLEPDAGEFIAMSSRKVLIIN